MDITKCEGVKDNLICGKRDTCYRYTATPNPQWQSYFIEAPFKIANKVIWAANPKVVGVVSVDCDSYWER